MTDCYCQMPKEVPDDAGARVFSPECDICKGAHKDRHVLRCPQCDAMQHLECLMESWSGGEIHMFACAACHASYAGEMQALILGALREDAGDFGVRCDTQGVALRKKM